MKISVLADMKLYHLISHIHQLQGLNKAFWTYVDANDTSISDPKLRALVDTVSELIDAEETLLNQNEATADEFVNAIEKYEPEKCTEEIDVSE